MTRLITLARVAPRFIGGAAVNAPVTRDAHGIDKKLELAAPLLARAVLAAKHRVHERSSLIYTAPEL